jgi:hypothetical protein
MRQVPTFHPAPLGIVGDGRVVRHFLAYFNLLGLTVRTWSRRRPASGPIDALRSAGPSSFSFETQRWFRSSTTGPCFQGMCAAFVRAYEGR